MEWVETASHREDLASFSLRGQAVEHQQTRPWHPWGFAGGWSELESAWGCGITSDPHRLFSLMDGHESSAVKCPVEQEASRHKRELCVQTKGVLDPFVLAIKVARP